MELVSRQVKGTSTRADVDADADAHRAETSNVEHK